MGVRAVGPGEQPHRRKAVVLLRLSFSVTDWDVEDGEDASVFLFDERGPVGWFRKELVDAVYYADAIAEPKAG